jgi:ankyrin repeat protein
MAMAYHSQYEKFTIRRRPLVGEGILIVETSPDIETVLLAETEHALFRAVASRNLSELTVYLQSGVNAKTVNEAGSTPLQLATKIGDLQMIELLLESSFQDREVRWVFKVTSPNCSWRTSFGSCQGAFMIQRQYQSHG